MDDTENVVKNKIQETLDLDSSNEETNFEMTLKVDIWERGET